MLIYGVADIHGNPRNVEAMIATVEKEKPDVLIVAGDMASHFFTGAEKVVKILSELDLPVFAVAGNSDCLKTKTLLDRHPGVVDLHKKLAEFNGQRFVGAGGTIPIPFRSRVAFFEKNLVDRLEELMEPGCVLVVHPPPFGTLDRVMGKYSAGSHGVAGLIKRARPSLCLCGHIHENAGTAMFDDTLVVNCAMGSASAGALIRMENGAIVDYHMVGPQ